VHFKAESGLSSMCIGGLWRGKLRGRLRQWPARYLQTVLGALPGGDVHESDMHSHIRSNLLELRAVRNAWLFLGHQLQGLDGQCLCCMLDMQGRGISIGSVFFLSKLELYSMYNMCSRAV